MEKNFELSEEKRILIGKLIKEQREKLGYSTNYAEIITGINKADISRIENGLKKKINPIYLKKLASALKMNQVELFNLAGFIDDEYLVSNVNLNNIKNIKMIEIPLYSSVSAGLGCETISEPIDFITIPEIGGNIIAVIVKGDSMENTIFDNSIAVVNVGAMPEIGEIGVFLTEEGNPDGLIKRLKYKNGEFILESDNKKYGDIRIKNSEFKAYGKVVHIINDTTKKLRDPLIDSIEKLDEEQQEAIKNMVKIFLKK